MPDDKEVKNTLNLPQTSFAMKASLVQKEPEILDKWDKDKLYEQILDARKGGPAFVLHDGPPYANGHLHLGTAMNKILKDFIIKSKNMQGYQAAYVPGWDCHGLPIEIHVDKKLGDKKKTMSAVEIREECRKYALSFVDIQRPNSRGWAFREWDNPI